jgi:hypothetical protein
MRTAAITSTAALVRVLNGAVACTVAVALAGCSSSKPASTVTVVPVSGTVDGGGYAHWLRVDWQAGFSQLVTQASSCSTLTADGHTIGFIYPADNPTGSATCTEPAGRPIYVGEATNECSTFPGNHGTLGPDDGKATLTATDRLPGCAKDGFHLISMSASVDGHPVDLAALVTTTGVFAINAVLNNQIGLEDQTGRQETGPGYAAATGAGILLTALSNGTHTVHVQSDFSGGPKSDYTFTLHVA